ncbi:MAG: hypothetical protein WA055_01055 [Candidatus Moraniibacteriota bacterium]
MKINKIISTILVLEFVYMLYKIVPIFLTTFDSTQPIPYIITFSIAFLLLISAVGIFFNKKWAVITLWIFILLPFLARTFLPLMAFIGGYYFVIINVIVATYLAMTFWKNKNENLKSIQ